MPFTILCTLIVTATLAALLYLNIQMSDTSYEITRLQSQSQRLTEEKQALTETDERLGTPQELERQAREIGMVPVTDPAYIDLDTGEIIGETSSTAQTEVNPELAHVARRGRRARRLRSTTSPRRTTAWATRESDHGAVTLVPQDTHDADHRPPTELVPGPPVSHSAGSVHRLSGTGC